MSGLSTAGRWSKVRDDRHGIGHILDGANDPIPTERQEAALRTVRRFVTEEASLPELFAMLGLVES